MVDWALIDKGCPNCGARAGGPRGLHYHGLSVWCLRCGWSSNWDVLPAALQKLKMAKR